MCVGGQLVLNKVTNVLLGYRTREGERGRRRERERVERKRHTVTERQTSGNPPLKKRCFIFKMF